MSSDDDDDFAPPPNLCATGDFARPQLLKRRESSSAEVGGADNGTKVFGVASSGNFFGDFNNSPSSLQSPTSLHSPASSFRWDRHQSFRLYATHSRAALSRRATGNFDAASHESLAQSENFGSSPLLLVPGAASPAMTVKTAQSKLKNFIMLNGDVTVTTDSSLPLNIRKGKLIGVGGYAEVYSGMNIQTGSLVAIKEIKIGDRSSPADFRDIQDEFALLRRLRHKNIVQYMLFEHSVSQKVCRIVMEFMPGGSTQQLLQKFGPLPEPILKKFATDILRGIEFIHRENITHRDIKPANILVDAQGTVKLADFGASKRINEINAATQNLIGTPVYMAPEFIKGQLNPKSDVWSLGCTLLELATGKVPWYHLGIREHLPLMFHITTSSDAPLIPADLSQECKGFFHLCFERNLSKRPSATELLNHAWIVNISADDVEGQQMIEDIGANQTATICDTLMTDERMLGEMWAGNVGESPLESPEVSPRVTNLSPSEAKIGSSAQLRLPPVLGGAMGGVGSSVSGGGSFRSVNGTEGTPTGGGGGGSGGSLRESPKRRTSAAGGSGNHGGGALGNDAHDLEKPQYLAIRKDVSNDRFKLETVYEDATPTGQEGDEGEGKGGAPTAGATERLEAAPATAAAAAAAAASHSGSVRAFAASSSNFGSFDATTLTPPKLGGEVDDTPTDDADDGSNNSSSNVDVYHPRLALDGPVRMSFSFNSAGRKVDLGLEIDPRDVSMKVIDRRPSFVVAMNDRIKNQITRAMLDMGADQIMESPERTPTASPLGIADAVLTSNSASVSSPPPSIRVSTGDIGDCSESANNGNNNSGSSRRLRRRSSTAAAAGRATGGTPLGTGSRRRSAEGGTRKGSTSRSVSVGSSESNEGVEAQPSGPKTIG